MQSGPVDCVWTNSTARLASRLLTGYARNHCRRAPSRPNWGFGPRPFSRISNTSRSRSKAAVSRCSSPRRHVGSVASTGLMTSSTDQVGVQRVKARPSTSLSLPSSNGHPSHGRRQPFYDVRSSRVPPSFFVVPGLKTRARVSNGISVPSSYF